MRTSAGATALLVRNSPDSQLEGFAICGKDANQVWAQAGIEGNEIVVWSDTVPCPRRFATTVLGGGDNLAREIGGLVTGGVGAREEATGFGTDGDIVGG